MCIPEHCKWEPTSSYITSLIVEPYLKFIVLVCLLHKSPATFHRVIHIAKAVVHKQSQKHHTAGYWFGSVCPTCSVFGIDFSVATMSKNSTSCRYNGGKIVKIIRNSMQWNTKRPIDMCVRIWTCSHVKCVVFWTIEAEISALTSTKNYLSACWK